MLTTAPSFASQHKVCYLQSVSSRWASKILKSEKRKDYNMRSILHWLLILLWQMASRNGGAYPPTPNEQRDGDLSLGKTRGSDIRLQDIARILNVSVEEVEQCMKEMGI